MTLTLAAAGVIAATTTGNAIAGPRPTAGTGYGIPALPDDGNTAAWDFAGTADATLARARATAHVPDTAYLAYLHVFAQPGQMKADDSAPCADFRPPTTSFDSDPGQVPFWFQLAGPVWATSPTSSALRYGTFPTAHVSGRVGGRAGAADVVLTQPLGRDGTVTPLAFEQLGTFAPVPTAGGTVNATGRYPAVTIPPNDGSLVLNELSSLRGSVDVRVNTVTLAGRPVDVGPSCRTTTTARVALSSPSGTYPIDATASSLHGRAGGFQPLSTTDPGALQGNVSIPAFTGCRSGGVDVSSLVTALVSGPRNAVELGLTRGFGQCTASQRKKPCPAFPTADGTRTSRTKSAAGFIR